MPRSSEEVSVLDVASARDWERWLERNHTKAPEGVWLRLRKKGQPGSTLEYQQAVEVALCFGWIDGQRKGLDDVSFLQPTRPMSAIGG